MDRATFELKIANLRNGEYSNDPALFETANDGLYSAKVLIAALRGCCQRQTTELKVARGLNKSLEASLRESQRKVESLTAELNSYKEVEA